jgi:tetratricopeptide (TPR) repeat protein
MSAYTPHEAIIKDPKQLPVMHPGKLIGREAELAQVYAYLKENRAVLIHGAVGYGKTALAATLATAYAQQPSGVLWLNVDNPRLDELLVRVGRAYDITEISNADTPMGMIGAVENTLKANKPFIVLDGSISADVLSRFISRCVDNIPLLVTATEAAVGAWETVEIPALDADQAAALFKREGRVAVNEYDDDVFEIVDTVGKSPLSIIITARAMAASKQTPEGLVKLLGQISSTTNTRGTTLALTTSFRTLNGALQGLMLMMGALFPSGASAELLSLVSGAAEDSIEQAMTILAQLHLVERTTRYGLHHYQMHTLVYQFANQSLETAGKLAGLRQKAREAIIAYARKHSTAGNADKLAAEIDTFVALALWARKHGDRPASLELAGILNNAGSFVRERGYVYEITQMRDTNAGSSPFPAYPEDALPVIPVLDDEDEESDMYAVDEDALEDVDDDDDPLLRRPVFSRPPTLFDEDDDDDDDSIYHDDEDDDDEIDQFDDEDDDDEDDFINGDSDEFDSEALEDELSPEDIMSAPPLPMLHDLTALDETQLRTALAQERQSGDLDKQIAVLKTLAERQLAAKMENEAIATYNEVLTAYEAIDDEDGTLEALDMLSALMVKTGNPQPAIMHASRGVRLAQDLADDITLTQLYITLGDARQALGESPQAIQDYNSALALTRQNDDTQHEAIVLYKLGYAQLDDGDADGAVDMLEQALSLFKAQGKRDYEGRVMGGLGSAFSDLERWSEAMRFYTSGLYIAREVGDKDEEALQLSSLAYAAVQAGQLGDAVLRYRQALHLALTMDNKDNIVSLIVDLARLLLRSESYASIADMLIKSAESYEPNDRDVLQLRDLVDSTIANANAKGIALKPVKGDARIYAENAYQLLNE